MNGYTLGGCSHWLLRGGQNWTGCVFIEMGMAPLLTVEFSIVSPVIKSCMTFGN